MNLFSKYFIETVELVNKNSDNFMRLIFNALLSYVFNVNIDNNSLFVKQEKQALNYFEFRILIYIRNRNFNLNKFLQFLSNIKEEDAEKVDYSIFEVLNYFRVYIKNPEYVDNLILAHKYTNDAWKNGSKYLYFYTLHNQEHAIELIKNSVTIIRTIDYFQISKLDYYILFLSCYLHDISMVIFPEFNSFLDSNEKNSNLIYSEFINKLESENMAEPKKIKILMLDFYKKIDTFFENKVRTQHAKSSAKIIRTNSSLFFLDSCLREFIANVSEAHCDDVYDIYRTKSEARESLVSLKFNKILLRLADLLDMSSLRVSKEVLNNNIDNMSTDSAFHWISHLLTKNFNLTATYENKNIILRSSYLTPKSIIENIVLTINVALSQLTEIDISEKCLDVHLSSIKENELVLQCDGNPCKLSHCNFLCKWFVTKNYYLFQELKELERYLNALPDNYFDTKIIIKLVIIGKTNLPQKQFEIISNYIN